MKSDYDKTDFCLTSIMENPKFVLKMMERVYKIYVLIGTKINKLGM